MLEVEKENQWKDFLKKSIKLYYDDSSKYLSRKIGLVLEVTATHMILKINGHKEAILLSRIVRVEELQ